jgi:hypothetical protein
MPVAEGADPLTPIARALVLAGFRRATVGLLAAETKDVTRITLRARARAGLRDLEGLEADLGALSALDATAARELRAKDPDVISALGPVAPKAAGARSGG